MHEFLQRAEWPLLVFLAVYGAVFLLGVYFIFCHGWSKVIFGIGRLRETWQLTGRRGPKS